MINILYSVLVAGSDKVPEDWPMYRRYDDILFDPLCVPTTSDPYRRSIYANYLIELAKLSVVYPNILRIDKSNTYKSTPRHINPYSRTSNCRVIRPSSVFPVINAELSVHGSGAVGSVNSEDTVLEFDSSGYLTIKDMVIQPDTNADHCSVDICNPSAVMIIPDKSRVSKLLMDVDKDIRDSVDLDTVYDRAGIICLANLNRYTKNVVL